MWSAWRRDIVRRIRITAPTMGPGYARGGGAITVLAAAHSEDRRVARNLMVAAAVLFAVHGAVTMGSGAVMMGWSGSVSR